MVRPESEWRKNKLTGNMAENIVEFLIESTPNWECIPYGVENHIKDLKKLLKNNHKNDTSKKISYMPDFIAINTKTNQVLMIEAKYRSFIDKRDPSKALYGFGYCQMKHYLKFWPDMYLIILHNHPPHFSVINLKDVEWYKHFHSRVGEGDKMIEQWNFGNIQKDIKDLFPELPDSAIKEAIERLPKKG